MTDAGERTCTCGADEVYYAPTDISDASNWPLFPILSFNIGDTGDYWEAFEYILGPLTCKQGDYSSIYSFVTNKLINRDCFMIKTIR